MKSWLIFLVGLVFGVAALVAVQQIPRTEHSETPVAVADVGESAGNSAAPAPAGATAPTQVSTAASLPAPPVTMPVTMSVSDVATPSVVATDATSPAPVADAAASTEALANLLLPVQGIAVAQLADTFTDARGQGRVHDAIDIMAARGTPVLATHDGPVEKLFTSVRGGITLYQFDPGRTHAYYYAHLDRYADGIAEGKVLHRGEVLGYVGSTGNASADAPHLHFAIFVLGPEKHWWQGEAINPYPLLRATR